MEVRDLQSRRLPPQTRIKALARALLRARRARTREVSIAFVTDRRMAALNRRFHGIGRSTDVLAFPYGNGAGEVIISAERARVQAARFGNPFAREIALYVIHGLLHLEGFRDHPPRERRRLARAEHRVLAWAEKRGLV